MTRNAVSDAFRLGHLRDRRSTGFLLAFALAYVGAVIGYFPLLTLLLPIKVDAVAGIRRMDVLTATVLAGAVASSVSNVVFGWLSDRAVARGGRRRNWVKFGVAAVALSYGAIASAASSATLIVAVVAFQVAVNALLAPLLAIMAEEVPDAQRGIAGGLLALAFPTASVLAAALAAASVLTETARLAVIPVAVFCCTMPLLLTHARPLQRFDPIPSMQTVRRRDLALTWSARLLVQVAGSALFVYLLYFFESVGGAWSPALVASRMTWVMIVAYGVPLPIAVLIGRLADRHGRTRLLLFAATLVAALGLVGMAEADSFGGGAIAFCVYMAGTVVFLSLHATFAMQLLPNPAHVGRDLGLLNLTNTLPSLLGPTLTWALSTPTDFDAVLLLLAAITLCGGGVILMVRGQRMNGAPHAARACPSSGQ